MKNADMPISPMLNENGAPHHYSNILVQDGLVEGLSKREHFASMAMQGLLASNATYNGVTHNRDLMAKDAIAHADALLKELDK